MFQCHNGAEFISDITKLLEKHSAKIGRFNKIYIQRLLRYALKI